MASHPSMREEKMVLHEKNSHCSFCGARFPADAGWPRACPSCGMKSYLNPLPVVVVLVPVGDGLVVVRRNTEPAKGTLTLPGGYIDYGETWEEAGKRELAEETGIRVVGELTLYEVGNGLDGTLVVFGLAETQPMEVLKPFCCEETEEVTLIHGAVELGFELHTQVVARYFKERK